MSKLIVLSSQHSVLLNYNNQRQNIPFANISSTNHPYIWLTGCPFPIYIIVTINRSIGSSEFEICSITCCKIRNTMISQMRTTHPRLRTLAFFFTLKPQILRQTYYYWLYSAFRACGKKTLGYPNKNNFQQR